MPTLSLFLTLTPWPYPNPNISPNPNPDSNSNWTGTCVEKNFASGRRVRFPLITIWRGRIKVKNITFIRKWLFIPNQFLCDDTKPDKNPDIRKYFSISERVFYIRVRPHLWNPVLVGKGEIRYYGLRFPRPWKNRETVATRRFRLVQLIRSFSVRDGTSGTTYKDKWLAKHISIHSTISLFL